MPKKDDLHMLFNQVGPTWAMQGQRLDA
jgi:hypothetical protein